MKKLISLIIGLTLIAISLRMSQAKNEWTERVSNTEIRDGTKLRNASIGGGVGVASGLGAGLLVGGIGVATGGLGFAIGIPALMALGGGGGALIGAASGDSPSKITTISEIPMSAPAYEPWMWMVTMAAGGVLCIIAFTSSEKSNSV